MAVAISLLEGVQLSARDEAVRWANGVKYGLASSVWTSDHKRELRMAKRLDFSCVWINCHIRLVAEMPYGGFKQSGYGKDLSMYGSRTTPGSNTSLSKIDT